MLDQVLDEAEVFFKTESELPKTIHASRIESPVIMAASQFSEHFAGALVLHRDEDDGSLLYTGVLLVSDEGDWRARFSCGSNLPEGQEFAGPILDVHFCWTTDVPKFDSPSLGAHLVYGLVAPDIASLSMEVGAKVPVAVNIQGPLRAFVVPIEGSNEEDIVITTVRRTGEREVHRFPGSTAQAPFGSGPLRLKGRRARKRK